MSRLSIDVTAEQHQRLKALAALKGLSIKQFVLASTLGAEGVDTALTELEALLEHRAQRAKSEGTATRTVDEIFERARDEIERDSDA
jgi:Antitoxin ParD